jgi:hypothetical protein
VEFVWGSHVLRGEWEWEFTRIGERPPRETLYLGGSKSFAEQPTESLPRYMRGAVLLNSLGNWENDLLRVQYRLTDLREVDALGGVDFHYSSYKGYTDPEGDPTAAPPAPDLTEEEVENLPESNRDPTHQPPDRPDFDGMVSYLVVGVDVELARDGRIEATLELYPRDGPNLVDEQLVQPASARGVVAWTVCDVPEAIQQDEFGNVRLTSGQAGWTPECDARMPRLPAPQ